MPEEYVLAWESWLDLHGSRGSNGFGYNPISYTEIKAFIELTGTPLLPYEIKGIKTIDAAFLKAYSEVSKISQANKNATKETTVQKRPAPTPRRR